MPLQGQLCALCAQQGHRVLLQKHFQYPAQALHLTSTPWLVRLHAQTALQGTSVPTRMTVQCLAILDTLHFWELVSALSVLQGPSVRTPQPKWHAQEQVLSSTRLLAALLVHNVQQGMDAPQRRQHL
jgi:hypothetical protein